MSIVLQSFGILSKLERWKSLISECLMSCKSKKPLFWSVILFCTATMNRFSIRLWHAMKSGLYMTTRLYMTSSVVGLRRSSKTLPKLKLSEKNVMITVWWSAAGLIHYSFLNPSRPITSEKYAQQVSEMHGTENCKVCSQHWSTERAQFSMTRPDHTTNALKVEWIGLKVLPHLPYSATLSRTDYHFFKHLDNFLQGKGFYNQQEAEDAFQEFVEISRYRFLGYRSKHFS